MAKEHWDYQKVWDIAITCSCVKELKEKNSKAYWAARRNDWVRDYTWFKRPDGNHATWTKEDAEAESRKYSCRSEFQKGSRGAYKAALREGWLDDFDWLQTPEKEHLWSYEDCRRESEKFLTPTEFKRGNPSAYNAAVRNKWLKDFDFPEKQTVWDEESTRREAEKYTSRSGFENGNASAYLSALRNGWLDSYTWLVRPVVHNKKWTRETAWPVAQRYLYKKDFELQDKGCYLACMRNGWLKEMDWFKPKAIENLSLDKSKYTVYIYKDEQNKSCYIGLTNNLRTRHNRHKNPYKPSVVYINFTECGIEIPYPDVLKENLTSEEAQYYEDFYVKEFSNDGWNVLNTGSTGVGVGSFGGGRVKYTHEKATEIAMSYDKLNTFSREQPSCYARCRKMGWLEEFTWLIRDITKRTYSECYEIAEKFSSIHELIENEPQVYNLALKHKWIKDYTWLERHHKCRTKEECAEISKQYEYAKQFRKAEPTIYAYCVKHKWIKDFTWLKTAEPKPKKWNMVKIIEIAKLYTDLKSFRLQESEAYDAACKLKCLDKLTWLKKMCQPAGYWTESRIIECSKSFDTLKSFRKEAKGAYGAARRLGILDKLTWLKRG